MNEWMKEGRKEAVGSKSAEKLLELIIALEL
jgi:hypothetical protein